MHDCSETKEQITELVLDGRQDEVLERELNRCAECRAEFDALSPTLRITTRLKELSVPAENYWVGYHARLRAKLENSATAFDAKPQRRKVLPNFILAPLRLCLKTTVPVPVPLIVAVVLLFAAAIVLWTKRPAPRPPSIVHVPVEVSVPVVQEKIVTRVVYRERRPRARTVNAEPKAETTFAKFKPTDEVKLTVIKGGSPYEK